MTCFTCNALVPDGAQTCPRCGAKLTAGGTQGTQGAHIPAFHRDLSTPANVRLVYLYWGPLRAFLVAQMVKNLPAMQEGSISGSGRSPGEGNGNPVFLPGKSHGWRSLAGYSPWGCKESDMTERLHSMQLFKKFPKELFFKIDNDNLVLNFI